MDREDIEERLLCEAIRSAYGFDLAGYAQASLRRRLDHVRRKWCLASLSQLQDRLLSGRDALHSFIDDLTVTTSELFRDPEFFLALRQQVVPLLKTFPSLNVWIAGCSTGEELYSLAIVLQEEGLLARTTIHATDVNRAALRAAREGMFPLDVIPQASVNYQKAGGTGSLYNHYTAAYGNVQMNRALRKDVVFAEHNLATDEVFCECQLVLCRNVLIYFGRPLQDRALGLFSRSLRMGGHLALGPKETVKFTSYVDDFNEIDPHARLYRKIPRRAPLVLHEGAATRAHSLEGGKMK